MEGGNTKYFIEVYETHKPYHRETVLLNTMITKTSLVAAGISNNIYLTFWM